MSSDENKTAITKITKPEALNLLPEGDKIHTFRFSQGMLLGTEYDRDILLQKINKYADTLQLGVHLARKINHALILEDESGYLNIETDEEKLKAYDIRKANSNN